MATHFEPCYARMAFPCFDQPSVRTKFQVRVLAPPDLLVLSNMPLSSASPTEKFLDKNNSEAQRVEWLFDWTPSISAYLLTWIIGVFDHLKKDVVIEHL